MFYRYICIVFSFDFTSLCFSLSHACICNTDIDIKFIWWEIFITVLRFASPLRSFRPRVCFFGYPIKLKEIIDNVYIFGRSFRKKSGICKFFMSSEELLGNVPISWGMYRIYKSIIWDWIASGLACPRINVRCSQILSSHSPVYY